MLFRLIIGLKIGIYKRVYGIMKKQFKRYSASTIGTL